MILRLFSAIIGIVILFIFLFHPLKGYFYFFIFLVTIISLAELYKIIFEKINFFFFLSVIFTSLLYKIIWYQAFNSFFFLFTGLIILLFSYLIIRYDDFKKESINVSKFLFSLIYIPLMSLYALYIYNLKNGQFLLLHFFIICWATDTFAYIVGTYFGKNKLCEKISPKKTYEGLWGGLAGGIIVGCFGKLFLNFNLLQLIAISLFTSIFCVFGDLFESLIKRKFNVKDSGILIPGHGGILDRIDGLLFAMPVYYFFIKLTS